MLPLNVIKPLVCSLVVLLLGGQANAHTRTAEQVYKEYHATSGLIQLEMNAKIAKGDFALPSVEPGSSFERSMQLQAELDRMANGGDPGGLFYSGLLKHEFGVKLNGSSSATDATVRLANDSFKEALQLFKRAGDAGEASGYFNAGAMYRNGDGVVKSNLAAAEWYYKAGFAYLKHSDRESALASLEAIQKLDKNSALAKKLEAALRRGGPK
jgi:TPR repeat protein